MFSKVNLVSTLLLTVWAFIGGWVLWGLIGEPLMEDSFVIRGVMKETPIMGFLAFGCLMQGFAFSSLYRGYGRGAYSAASGLELGLWIALLIGLGSGLIDHATANLVDLDGTMINFVLCVVYFGVMGVLAGFIYKKMDDSD